MLVGKLNAKSVRPHCWPAGFENWAAVYMGKIHGRASRSNMKNIWRRALLCTLVVVVLTLSYTLRSQCTGQHLQLQQSRIHRSNDENVWRARTRTSLRETKRHGKGIYFFTYGTERTFHHFERMAIEAAASFKKHSPGLPLAIATSHDSKRLDDFFDFKILIREDHDFAGSNYQKRPDGMSRQWLTRILYLTATPFEVTIAYDANVISCNNILPALNRLARDDFDFAVATSSRSNSAEDIFPHNFALAFRWNEDVASFLDAWFMEQVSTGVSMDDQHTLLKAAREFQKSKPHFRFRPLDPVVASAFVSTAPKLGFFPRETRILTGEVLVIHVEHTYSAQPGKLCEIFNAAMLSRQILFTTKENFTIAFSGEECARALADTHPFSCVNQNLWSDKGKHDLVPSTTTPDRASL